MILIMNREASLRQLHALFFEELLSATREARGACVKSTFDHR